MKKLVLLMAVLVSGVAMAQETVVERKENGFAVVKDGDGTLRTIYSPTPQFALNRLLAEESRGRNDAAMIFKQKWERRSDAELDAFADELVRLVMETPSRKVADYAIYALRSHKRGLEILTDIYENLDGTEAVPKYFMLWDIFRVPGGKDYVMNLYASLERPAAPCKLRPQGIIIKDGKRLNPDPPEEEQCPYKTQWCEVAQFLVGKELADPAYVYPICDKHWVYEDGRWGRRKY